MKWLSE